MVCGSSALRLECLPDRIKVRASRALMAAPALALPVVTIIALRSQPPWVLMWSLAFAIYASAKWISWLDHPPASTRQALLYIFCWPGMNTGEFFAQRQKIDVSTFSLCFPLVRIAYGVFLIWIVSPRLPDWLAPWPALAGMIFILHFGIFELLARRYQRAGIPVRRVMESPPRSTSVSEFWGSRWNTAFSSLARKCMFEPLRSLCGTKTAFVSVFVASAVIHEAVISLPARGGYGLPTLYYCIQLVAISFERSRFGRKLGLRRGLRGRAFTAFAVLAPAVLHFHPAFMQRVMLPFVHAIGAR